MTIALNADIQTLIFDHVDDQKTLHDTITALSISKHHSLRNVLVRRFLQRPLRVSSDAIGVTRALLELLIQHSHSDVASVQRVRKIELSLGPSRNMFAFGSDPEGKEHLRIENAVSLVNLLPRFFAATTNLRHLTWIRVPLPDPENLKILAQLPKLESFSVDCATGAWSSRGLDAADEYWEIKPFFETLGPKLISLDLRNVSQNVFYALCDNMGLFRKLESLKMDLTCGVWDWSGGGSSQAGPTENFTFPKVGKRLRNFGAIIGDVAIWKKKPGPLDLVNAKHLEELILYINPCFAWTHISGIRMFESLTATDYVSLTYLELRDDARDSGIMRWDGPPKRSHTELGRAFFGLHEFISQLPSLVHLLVNERSLVIPKDNSDRWNPGRFHSSTDDNMRLTQESPQWAMLPPTFEKLESLRVGFGPMTTNWVETVLDMCDPVRLKRFGFDFDWKALGRGKPIPVELSRLFSRFPSLSEIHILHPRPKLENYAYDEATISDVRAIFQACPSVLRVGVGKNVAWERETPWGSSVDVPIQLVSKKSIPRFFDAGYVLNKNLKIKAFDELDEKGIFEENEALLNWLKQSS